MPDTISSRPSSPRLHECRVGRPISAQPALRASGPTHSPLARPHRQGPLPVQGRGGRARARAAGRATDRGRRPASQLDRSFPVAACPAAAATSLFHRCYGHPGRPLVEARRDPACRRCRAGDDHRPSQPRRAGAFAGDPGKWEPGRHLPGRVGRETDTRDVAAEARRRLPQRALRAPRPAGRNVSGTLELWRGATLRVRIAPPLDALTPGADRNEEQVFVDRLREVLTAIVPPQPPPPPSGKKPWRWLTHLI